VAAADNGCCAQALDEKIANVIAGAAMRMIRRRRFGWISLTCILEPKFLFLIRDFGRLVILFCRGHDT
jgi:hypothetical protein